MQHRTDIDPTNQDLSPDICQWQPPAGMAQDAWRRWAVLAYFAEAGDCGATPADAAKWLGFPEREATCILMEWVASGAIRPVRMPGQYRDFAAAPACGWTAVFAGGDA